MEYVLRLAEERDVPELEALIVHSARTLQASTYAAGQIEAALGPVFGVDRQLIRDGTYWVAGTGGRIVGCGGWSRRRSRFGGDAARNGEDPRRDPASEPAMIRAFFVDPAHVRRGLGRRLLACSEEAARAAGFSRIELAATLAGVPLYRACGYEEVAAEEVALPGGLFLPIVRMRRAFTG